MRKIRLFSVFALLILLISVGCSVGMAQKPPSADSGDQGHLLIRPTDVTVFGDVEVAVPEGSVENREAIDRRPLVNWEEGHSTVLLVTSPDSGELVALIRSASYRFPSTQAAQTALDALPDPMEDYSWESVAEDDVSVFDDDLLQSLEGRSWHVWYGIDDEGVPAYFLWIQSDAYVIELYLNVLQEPLGRQMLNHIVRSLINEGIPGATHVNPTKTEPNSVKGTRVTGPAGELLLASPFVVDRTDPPRPAPLRSLEEVGAEGAWLPGWLPAGIQSEPIASTWTTAAGDRVTRIEFQVTHSGQTRPVMIVQVDGPSEKGLTYASPTPAWLEQADHGVASVTRAKLPARPADDAATMGDRDVRLARYESATINGRPAEAILEIFLWHTTPL